MGEVREMPMTYQISAEQREEIAAQKKKTMDARIYRKLEVLWFRAEGKTNSEAAELTGYSESRVNHLVSEYCRNGIGYFLEEHRKGGNRRNMPKEKEVEFLEGFRESAEAGKELTVRDVLSEYRKIVPEAYPSTVYDLLRRHKWRKVMPRPRHPKAASEAEQEASKNKTKVR